MNEHVPNQAAKREAHRYSSIYACVRFSYPYQLVP
jgi:hypothetical protein